MLRIQYIFNILLIYYPYSMYLLNEMHLLNETE